MNAWVDFYFSSYFRYSLGLSETKLDLKLSLTITHCIDSSCEDSNVLSDVSIPIQYCNGEMEIPGDGTVTGLVDAVDGKVGSIGVTFIQFILGFDVSKNLNNI